MKRFYSSMLAVLWVLSSPAVVQAAADAKGIQAALRTVEFFSGLANGGQEIMVVYDPAQASARAEAEAVAAAIRNATSAKLKLTPVLTPANALGEGRILYLTQGSEAYMDAIAAHAGKHRALTITNDVRCVERGKCVMYVASNPAIEIRISRAALAASSLQMAAALKMMVKEIE